MSSQDRSNLLRQPSWARKESEPIQVGGPQVVLRGLNTNQVGPRWAPGVQRAEHTHTPSPCLTHQGACLCVQIAELVDCKNTGDTYEVEYTVQKLPGPKRHLFSSVRLGSNGRWVCFNSNEFQADHPIISRQVSEYRLHEVSRSIPGMHSTPSDSTGLHACRYNRLFTVTGQCLEEDLPKFDAVIKTAVRSLKAELQPTL